MRWFTLTAVLIPVGLLAAGNPFLGTWRLNPEKSKASPTSFPKQMTVTFEQDGDKVRRTVSGVDGEGRRVQLTASTAWDGKEHQTQSMDGALSQITIRFVNEHERDVTVKREGRVITKVRSVVSKDGATMTNTTEGVTPEGVKYHSVTVYDRQ